LHWKQGLRFSFCVTDKVVHLAALEAANQNDLDPLEAFFRERLSAVEA
jgi:primosomal protein N''